MTIIKFSLTYTTFEKIRELLALKIDFGQDFFFFFCGNVISAKVISIASDFIRLEADGKIVQAWLILR